MEIALKNIKKTYGDKRAVDNISLSLKPGIYGLLGANGAGKTTLMNIICGVIKADSGNIYLNGEKISPMSVNFRSLLGYTPQDFGFDKVFKVKDYLEYMAALKGLTSKEAKEKINKLIDLLNLNDYKNKKVCKLSGGTSRRVGIAQALLNDPKILIFDEPTSGLDPGERIRLRQLISNLSRDKIIILSTHIVSDIENISNENIIMKKGQIISSGDAQTLINGINGKVWSINCAGIDMDKILQGRKVINTHYSENGLVNVRFISEDEIESAKMEKPTLEDVYFWFFRDQDNI